MGKLIEILEKLNWSRVILLVGVWAGYCYFMLDTTTLTDKEQSVQAMQAEISVQERKIQEAHEFARQFEDKKKRYADLVKELQKLQGALPKQFFLPDLLSELLREAKQLEIEITAISPDGSETQLELYNAMGFNLEIRGTFLQFFIFLDRLAHMKRLITVERFSLEKDASRERVTLGGETGAFSSSRLIGGMAAYPGVRATVRLITYRYRGGQ
jgi:Tfp pilus assembly protein PilO